MSSHTIDSNPETRHWVRFVVRRVPATKAKPHGLDYSLTPHGPDGERLVGSGSAYPVSRGERGRIRPEVPCQAISLELPFRA